MVGSHDVLPDGQHTLMGAVLLREHSVSGGPAVVDEHDVHGAVANVAQHIHALEVPDLAGYRRKALGEHIGPGDLHPVGLSPERKAHLTAPHKVGFEILPLLAHPGEGQAHRKAHRGVGQSMHVQLTGDSGQGEDIIVVVPGLIGGKLLVARPDQVVAAIIHQQLVLEHRLGVMGGQPCRETAVGGLDVAIAVVDADDLHALILFHRLHSSFRCVSPSFR